MRLGNKIKFKKKEIIFSEGEEYRGFYVVIKGSVKIGKLSFIRKEYILHIIKPNQTFADVPLFEGGNYPVNATALEDCELFFISKQGFVDLLKNNSSISLKMLAGFAKRLKSLTVRVEDLTLREVTSRLAHYILDEIKRNGTIKLPEPSLKLTISKTNLASYLGTITETLSRTFNRLQERNIIRVHGKKIFIQNLPELQKLVDQV